MTLKDILDSYKNKNASIPYSDQDLTGFVQNLDRMVQTDILNEYPKVYTTGEDGKVTETDGTLISYDYDADQCTAVKLSGTPFEDVYELYIASMIAFDTNDWIKYSNLKIMFNARFTDATRYYARTVQFPVSNNIHNLW